MIIRYMSLRRFEEALQSQSLWFCKMSLLEDPLEGSFPSPNLNDDDQRGVRQTVKALRNWTVANCWYENDHESALMWNAHLKDDCGVAIRSTVGRLKQCVEGYPRSVYVGSVKYIDFDRDSIPKNNLFHVFTRKNRVFAEERELRAVVMYEFAEDISVHPASDEFKGIQVPVDLNTLIESLIVFSKVSLMPMARVQEALEMCDLGKPVRKSELSRQPAW